MPLEVRWGYRGCWELNAGPFRKPARLLTPELSPQPCCFSYKMSEHVPAGLWGVLIVAVPQWGTVSYCPRVWQSSVNAVGAWTVWKSKLQPNPGTIRDLQINFISFGSKVSKTERENSVSHSCACGCVSVCVCKCVPECVSSLHVWIHAGNIWDLPSLVGSVWGWGRPLKYKRSLTAVFSGLKASLATLYQFSFYEIKIWLRCVFCRFSGLGRWTGQTGNKESQES